MHHMTTGAGNDIERATDLARKMVCEWGMSELGPFELRQEGGAETAIRIDEQVKKLVQGGYDTAAEVLNKHSDALVKIAETLLEREILDGNEVMQIISGATLPPMSSTGSRIRRITRSRYCGRKAGAGLRAFPKGSVLSRH